MKHLSPILLAALIFQPSWGTVCKWAEVPPVIDGKDDDPAWKVAVTVGDFQKAWADDPAKRTPRTKTEAKLCWDRDNLYFFARMEDGDLYATNTEQDGDLWNDDVFELFFKPVEDFPGYYEFEFNLNNAVLDFYFPRRGGGSVPRFRREFEFHAETKVQLDGTLNKWTDQDKGWTIEGKLPWKDFIRAGGRPRAGDTWKYTACRYDYSVDFEGPDLSSSAPLKRANFHLYEDYQDLVFEGPVPLFPPASGVTIKGSPGKPAPFKVVKAYPVLEGKLMPISAVAVPGTNRMLAITQDRAYAQTRVITFEDKEDATAVRTLLEQKGTAYDFAFHPDFAENGFLFLGWNDGKKSLLTRFKFDAQAMEFDKASETVFLTWDGNGHNGAAIDFGPDGMLYVTTGDGTSDSDTLLNGQRTNDLHAKLLRIDVDKPSGGKPYSVPPDNPYVNDSRFVPETWAYGFRNPWRLDVDEKTGQVWVGQNGQDLWEQAYLVEKGANYGWSVVEGSHPFYPGRERGPHPIQLPAVEHSHAEARSLTGGIVYHGCGLPGLDGHYIYGDYSTGKIWAAKYDGEKVSTPVELVDSPLKITDFNLNSRGGLLVLDHGDQPGQGGFYRLVPVPDSVEENDFPKRLSETGLFKDVAKRELAPGVVPYAVNAEQWADGAMQERAIALPAFPNENGVLETERIGFHRDRTWNLPEGTVLMKTLSFPGKPVETQILTLQGGDWAGYAYKWNQAGTDAELVESNGEEAILEIPVAKGTRQQAWRHASRAECMFCHSRASGFTLTMNSQQMNRDYPFAGNHKNLPGNQLAALDRLGFFSDDWATEVKNRLVSELAEKGTGTHGDASKKARQIAEKEVKELFGGNKAYPHAKSDRLAFAPDVAGYKKQANPHDPKASLDDRARSYLHTNCGNCHIGAGGGNAAFNLTLGFDDEKRELFGVKPKHLDFGLPDARLLAPGKPGSSVLLHRMGMSTPGQMPIIGRKVVDRKGVALVKQWIESMSPMDPDKDKQQAQPVVPEEKAVPTKRLSYPRFLREPK